MKEVILVKKGAKPVLMVDGREMAMRFPKEEQGKKVDLSVDIADQPENPECITDMAKIIKARQQNQVSTETGDVGGTFMTKEQKLTLTTELVEGAESREIEDKYCLINGIA